MAAGLFIAYLRDEFWRFQKSLSDSADWPPFVGHQQQVGLRQLVPQQTIKSILQPTGPWPT
jgi:hypothetical protein